MWTQFSSVVMHCGLQILTWTDEDEAMWSNRAILLSVYYGSELPDLMRTGWTCGIVNQRKVNHSEKQSDKFWVEMKCFLPQMPLFSTALYRLVHLLYEKSIVLHINGFLFIYRNIKLSLSSTLFCFQRYCILQIFTFSWAKLMHCDGTRISYTTEKHFCHLYLSQVFHS